MQLTGMGKADAHGIPRNGEGTKKKALVHVSAPNQYLMCRWYKKKGRVIKKQGGGGVLEELRVASGPD